MAVTTNSTIEFASKEELNNYLSTNSYAFSSVNYLISHINNVWYVTIPRGSVVGGSNPKVKTNTAFDASQGINLSSNPKDIWYPGMATNGSTTQKYISAQVTGTPTSWNHNSVKNLSQLKLSYITSATFFRDGGMAKIAVHSNDEFKQAWRDNHTSYRITKIEAWGVKQ